MNTSTQQMDCTALYKAMQPISPKLPASKELYETLVALCQKNDWVKIHGWAFIDDPILELDSPYSFCTIDDISMLKLYFQHGNWSIRSGVVYKDLFFCNQIEGGDEWWTCRCDQTTGQWIPFESITFRLVIEGGEFESMIQRMLTASVEDIKKLNY